MMKVVVIGADGQLGSDLVRVCKEKFRVTPFTHHVIEIADIQSCEKIKSYQPEVVINTAAYHNVPMCEENPLQSFKVNALGALHLAQICSQINAILVHISTDYVFDGLKNEPYLEQDMPYPLNTYGITKLAGENYIRANCKKYMIVRTSGLYGEHKCKAKERNFPELMLNLYKQGKEIRVVNDEYLTPTFTYDLAIQIRDLVQIPEYGIFHITSDGACSWYDFAVKIFEILKIPAQVIPVSAVDFPAKVRRPGYSVLENGHLKKINCDHMRGWQDALSDYLSRVRLA